MEDSEETARQKSIAIHNLCLGDNAYRTTYDAERIAVETAYRNRVESDGEEVKTEGRIGPGE